MSVASALGIATDGSADGVAVLVGIHGASSGHRYIGSSSSSDDLVVTSTFTVPAIDRREVRYVPYPLTSKLTLKISIS